MRYQPFKIAKLCLILAVLYISAYSISFTIGRHRQHCFNVRGPGKYQVQYEVSGSQQENILFTVQNQQGLVISRRQRQASGSQQIDLQKNSVQKFCFQSYDTLSKTVSFEIIQIQNVAVQKLGEKEFEKIYKNLEQLHHDVQKLYGHQHFYLDRNRIHRNKLNEIHDKIKYLHLGKIILIILCTLIQYLVIKSFISPKGAGYHSFNHI